MSNKSELQNRFIVTFKKFIEFLDDIQSSARIRTVLDKYDRVRDDKADELINRFVEKTAGYKEMIMNNDLSFLENDNISILPKVHLQNYWELMDDSQKERMVLFMELLVRITAYYTDTVEVTSIKGSGMSISSMVAQGGYNLEKTGIKSVATRLGFDIDKLVDDLNNVSDDDIQEASGKVLQYMGNPSEQTADLMTGMISTIGQVLKETRLSSDSAQDFFGSILNISEEVMNRTRANFEDSGLDKEEFMNAARNMSSQISKDISGTEVGIDNILERIQGNPEGLNPSDILENMGK